MSCEPTHGTVVPPDRLPAPPLDSTKLRGGAAFCARLSPFVRTPQYAAAMPLPTTPYPIHDDDDFEQFVALLSEESLQGVIVMDRRVHICSENDEGEVWAASFPDWEDEEDPGLEPLDDVWSDFRTSNPHMPAMVVHLEAW